MRNRQDTRSLGRAFRPALDASSSGVHGSWCSPSASSPGISTALGASTYWAAIEIAIQP